MKQTIYVDVLLAVNFFINYFLMLSVGKLMRGCISRTRICLSALFGAVTALSILLPSMPMLLSILFKLAVSAVMVLIAYPWQNRRCFVRYLLAACAVTFGFGGMMLTLWLMVAPNGMYYRNGVAYFHLSPVFIVVATILCYTLITLAGRLLTRYERRSDYCEATVTGNGRAVCLRLICDTGNLLTEPFSGYPVIVAKRNRAAKLMPDGFAAYSAQDGVSMASPVLQNFRIIPYSSVGGNGFLTAFRPDKVKLSYREHTYETRKCYIAVSDSFNDEEYDGIIHPSMFDAV